MSDVTLREVTRENWRACVRLTVDEAQADFVAPNVYSLAESKFEPAAVPLAVYAGETMVGFVMYALEGTDGWIWRLMVDRAHQGKGYGRAAMEEVIRRLRALPGVRRIRTSFVPANAHAAALYRALGFHETGEVEQGEVVVELREDAAG
ncbi:MAG TPA: GNAT family N-acetyltransferase [Longimicrobium sp.]|nr:GNAT family N-acetyltransferase [Longimicrobium sp.]